MEKQVGQLIITLKESQALWHDRSGFDKKYSCYVFDQFLVSVFISMFVWFDIEKMAALCIFLFQFRYLTYYTQNNRELSK